MKADYMLLGVLARRGMSGYELAKWLESEGYFFGRKPSMTPIYRGLADLVDRGWVEVETVSRPAAPDARIHRPTLAGRRALVEWASSPFTPSLRPMDPDFIVRLNFAGQMGPEIALDIVTTELDFRLKQRADEGGPFRELVLDQIPEINPAWVQRVEVIARSRGWQSTSLYIGWLESLKSELEAVLSSSDAAAGVLASSAGDAADTADAGEATA